MIPLGAVGWPVLDRVHVFGDFAISPHGLGIAIGFLFGAWIFTREGPKRGVTLDHVNSMVFWAKLSNCSARRWRATSMAAVTELMLWRMPTPTSSSPRYTRSASIRIASPS